MAKTSCSLTHVYGSEDCVKILTGEIRREIERRYHPVSHHGHGKDHHDSHHVH